MNHDLESSEHQSQTPISETLTEEMKLLKKKK